MIWTEGGTSCAAGTLPASVSCPVADELPPYAVQLAKRQQNSIAKAPNVSAYATDGGEGIKKLSLSLAEGEGLPANTAGGLARLWRVKVREPRGFTHNAG
jgi:hypothetical protein